MSGLIGIRRPAGAASQAGNSPTATYTKGATESPASSDGVRPLPKAAGLGVLSVHFERGRCRVQCPFCYLGQRDGSIEPAPSSSAGGAPDTVFDTDPPTVDLLVEAVHRLPYRELAITLSEPIEPVVQSGALLRLLQAARSRGLPTAITTTLAVAVSPAAAGLSGFSRLSLSIDPFKGPGGGRLQAPVGQVSAADVADALAQVAARWPSAERVLIATLSTQRFAEQLCDGLLHDLLAIPTVDRIALNAIKPPPSWCDRAFWLRSLHRLRPLLDRYLDRRLFLDCYVAARILGLGDCPARPDLSPAVQRAPAVAADGSPSDSVGPVARGPDLALGLAPSPAASPQGGLAFRSCVYQAQADFEVSSMDALEQRVAHFVAPAVCPFPIR